MTNNQLSIKALRVNNGFTQEALAQRLGVSAHTLSRWENKEIPVKPLHVYAIAYALKVDADMIRV